MKQAPLLAQSAVLRLLLVLLAGIPSATAWQPGTYPTVMHTRGFAVQNLKRNDVVAFWHAVYQASEGYENRINWSGNYSGSVGTVSPRFTLDVQRRINWFRAMCGVPSDIFLNPDATVVINPTDPFKPEASTRKAGAAQTSALMVVRNYDIKTGFNPAMSHNPGKTLKGWTVAAWNAASKSNLSFGSFGPGAINEYMIESSPTGSTTSPWNVDVGHRRWILYPRSTTFASGDQPGESISRPPTNTLYIIQNTSELRPAVTPRFVAYPAAGFFPAPVNSPFWSLCREGADFSKASVTMRDASGKSVAISNIRRHSGFGDPAIIWRVPSGVASRAIALDKKYRITVSGIAGTGVPTSHTYDVILVNPDILTSNQSISGPRNPSSKSVTNYKFTPPTGAEGLRVTTYRHTPATWKEGAELTPKPAITSGTTGNYPLMVDPSSKMGFSRLAGTKSFNLTFPQIYDLMERGVPEQSFTLKHLVIPKRGATVKFLYRRGYMTAASRLAVEMSRNGGATWTAIGKRISGSNSGFFDASATTATFKIPASTQPVMLRFRYYVSDPFAPVFTHDNGPGLPTGIFIDEIRTTNCDWMKATKVNPLAAKAKSFGFGSKTAGARLVKGQKWAIALQTKLGGRWFPDGPMKQLVIGSP